MEKKLDNYDNLIISRKATSIVSALMILICVFTFIAGYFWGYRRASSGLQDHINNKNLVDQVNRSIDNEFGGIGMVPDLSEAKIDSVVLKKENSNNDSKSIDSDSKHEYYAELIGFGYLKAAQKFVDQAKKKGYPVHLRKRVGKTGNGKTIHWYQAITKKFTNKAELDKLLKSIKKTENIKQGIKIKNS